MKGSLMGLDGCFLDALGETRVAAGLLGVFRAGLQRDGDMKKVFLFCNSVDLPHLLPVLLSCMKTGPFI